MEIKPYWKARQREVEAAIKRYLPRESVKPVTIHKAMRYSMMAGGKRLRPILCLAGAEAITGGEHGDAIPLAVSVECIHTYSLIHDDLPAMDNDDFRRGKPTSHKVFGEAIAILAGDALLTSAFEIAASCRAWPRYKHADVIKEVAHAAGSLKLIAGQVADIENEGKKNFKLSELRYIHERKTAALIASSVRLGGMSANCTPKQLEALTTFGQSLGLAFQVIDDILDITQTTEKLGKSAGKDLAAEKSTYPALMGLDGAKKEAARLTDKALGALKPFGKKADPLRAISDVMLKREN